MIICIVNIWEYLLYITFNLPHRHGYVSYRRIKVAQVAPPPPPPPPQAWTPEVGQGRFLMLWITEAGYSHLKFSLRLAVLGAKIPSLIDSCRSWGSNYERINLFCFGRGVEKGSFGVSMLSGSRPEGGVELCGPRPRHDGRRRCPPPSPSPPHHHPHHPNHPHHFLHRRPRYHYHSSAHHPYAYHRSWFLCCHVVLIRLVFCPPGVYRSKMGWRSYEGSTFFVRPFFDEPFLAFVHPLHSSWIEP